MLAGGKKCCPWRGISVFYTDGGAPLIIALILVRKLHVIRERLAGQQEFQSNGDLIMRKPKTFGNRTLNRQLRFEGLEPRAMLTGTVTATNSGGLLLITGDDANNAIAVHQTASGGGAISVQVQGIATKISNLDTGTIGNSFTFDGVTDISIAMNGGCDMLTMSNTSIPNTLSIDMGDGNDLLTMTNVHEQLLGTSTGGLVVAHAATIRPAAKPHVDGDISISLGSGNDVAVLNNVTSAGDINIDADDGIDVVTLVGVSAGMVGSGNTLTVDMGAGRAKVLTVISTTADFADFTSGGSFGLLNFRHLRNHFSPGGETDSGFSIVV
jgi:hypothetical protein